MLSQGGDEDSSWGWKEMYFSYQSRSTAMEQICTGTPYGLPNIPITAQWKAILP